MILGVIQCRMSSQRLPGKVLMPIYGIPILLFMAMRVQESRKIDKLIIATSTDKTDDPIRELCQKHKLLCFSGNLEDVLDRFYWLSQIFCPEHIARLTADCPMIDTEIMDRTIDYHIKGGFDYTRNYGYPDGMDTEIMSFKALCEAWRDSISPYDREHVTPYLYNHPEFFKLGRLENEIDQSHVKISVDTEEDYIKLTRLLEIAIWANSTFLNQRPF